MTSLVRRERRDEDDVEHLRVRLAELERTLDVRESELTRLKADLHVFKAAYLRQVGTLYKQLDELEAAIAEAELGELKAQLDAAADSRTESPPPRRSEAPRFTSDAVRKLFRDVAKAIHPDRAGDAMARERRHELMAEANRAYAEGDEEQLRLILASWEKSPEAVIGTDTSAIRLRLIRRTGQIEERLSAIAAELDELTASPVYALKAKVDEAAAKNRDLIREMVKRLERDVMVATNRLEAMRGST